MLSSEQQTATDPRIEEVDLAVGAERHDAAVGSNSTPRYQSPRLGARADVEGLNERRNDNVGRRIRRSPGAAIDAIQSDRAFSRGAFADEIQRRVAGRYVDRLDVRRSIRVPQAQHRLASA